MMTLRSSEGMSWGMMAIIFSMATVFAGGSIWLGAVSKQVDVNTSRLTRGELLLDDIRQHDANTTAELKNIWQRLDRLEHPTK